MGAYRVCRWEQVWSGEIDKMDVHKVILSVVSGENERGASEMRDGQLCRSRVRRLGQC